MRGIYRSSSTIDQRIIADIEKTQGIATEFLKIGWCWIWRRFFEIHRRCHSFLLCLFCLVIRPIHIQWKIRPHGGRDRRKDRFGSRPSDNVITEKRKILKIIAIRQGILNKKETCTVLCNILTDTHPNLSATWVVLVPAQMMTYIKTTRCVLILRIRHPQKTHPLTILL